MHWKSFVEADQAKRFVLPAGWDARDKIADQLECGVDRVGRLLAPAIKAGRVETQVFPVWDAVTKRVMRVTAYRRLADKAEKR